MGKASLARGVIVRVFSKWLVVRIGEEEKDIYYSMSGLRKKDLMMLKWRGKPVELVLRGPMLLNVLCPMELSAMPTPG
ncbi:MAG: hypothetical protein FJ320_05580 [SAR202 cluster bacterium]|nr:hypothetical protein [SAR202 cluster bacterium]